MPSIKINVTDDLVLDAGTVVETAEGFTIHPPGFPMIDQLISYLDDQPYHYSNVQIQRLGVGLSALCVRWGSYLATLMDASTELHPAIPGLNKSQPEEYGLIHNLEMKRLNIEISFNLYRMVQIFRERGDHGLYELLSKAHDHLPMPQKRVGKNREAANRIFTALALGAHVVAGFERGEIDGLCEVEVDGTRELTIRRIAPGDADRFLANTLTYHAWRNTSIEDIHGGRVPTPRLQPHQQRFTASAQRSVLREVTANLGAVLFLLDPLFNENYRFKDLPAWPQTATALANSLHGSAAFDWSLVDTSSSVMLPKG